MSSRLQLCNTQVEGSRLPDLCRRYRVRELSFLDRPLAESLQQIEGWGMTCLREEAAPP